MEGLKSIGKGMRLRDLCSDVERVVGNRFLESRCGKFRAGWKVSRGT